MEIAIEYEYGEYLEFEGETLTFLLGGNHDIKWKIYRGLKRFSTGKTLSDLEENVYGDDGIVIKCDEKKMKAKDLPMYFLDCRESFLEQGRCSKGSMMQAYIDSLERDFTITRQLDILNDTFLQMEVVMQEYFQRDLEHVVPVLRAVTYKDIVKNFLDLSFYENEVSFPIEMMDIAKLIDDYCTLIREEITRNQKKIWLWINNPNAFIAKRTLPIFIAKLKQIAEETGLLHIFVMSDDYMDLSYTSEDIPNTILLYDDYQQLPDFEILAASLCNHYPEEREFETSMLIHSLYRVFPYIGWDSNVQEIYLKPKDMVLLKVVTQLLNCLTPVKSTEFVQELSEMEKKFLLS